MVVASKDKKLANAVQQLLASSYLRINTSRYNISKPDSIGINDFWMHFPAGLCLDPFAYLLDSLFMSCVCVVLVTEL